MLHSVVPGMKKLWAMTLLGSLLVAGTLGAQTDKAAPAAAASTDIASDPFDPDVKQVSGCCGGGSLPPGAANYPYTGGQCVPGRTCGTCDSVTPMGKLCSGIYENICCPDPCYEPRWIPAANAAFFQDSPRPVTQTRIGWDAVNNYGFPDGAEFFWGKIGTKGPANPSPSLNYNQLTLYQEIAAKGASAFVAIPYLSVEPQNDPSAAGFGDISMGAKSVVLDRELLLLTTQFKTTVPVGNFTAGLGTGHVTLEPSLLAALKLGPETYLQMQIADWIPIAGDPGFAGMVFHYHFSLNHNLYQQGDFLNIVGTMEFNGYTFRGEFTQLDGSVVGMGGTSYFNAGPGVRLQICEKWDIGVGMAFGFGSDHGPGETYRTELRFRF
jgi:hypothetical protein